MSGAIGDDGSQAQEEKKGTLFHAGDLPLTNCSGSDVHAGDKIVV